MEISEAIDAHIEECKHRIDVIKKFMITNGDADKGRCYKNIDLLKTVIYAMQELREYKHLGTLEELSEMVEKQRAKKATYEGDGYAPDGTFVWDEWLCPCCGSRFEVEYEEHDYCPNCGQHILWEVADEQ